MQLRILFYTLFIFILSLFILNKNYTAVSSGSGQPPVANNQTVIDFDKSIYQWCQVMAEIFHIVHTKYYQEVDPEEAMMNALSAFVKSLDPHSDFMRPKSYKEILEATQGEFPGIGIHVDNTKEIDDDHLRVIDTVPGGPAEKAHGTDSKGNIIIGLAGDDKIVEINGDSLRGMSLEEAISKIKGKRNTTVHIKVIRPGMQGLISFDIVRDIVQEQNALCYYFADHNIYYLSLNMFTENSVKQIEQLLQKSQQQASKALILDLRNNSGGLLNAVVDIAGLFVPKGSVIVTTKNKNGKTKDHYATTREPIAQRNIPIFVLTNNYTASAAEILAGYLQLYAQQNQGILIFLVGSKTFGKGSVQEVIPVSNDCALRLTIALYMLPNNTVIQGIGVSPDFEIEPRLSAPTEIAWFNKLFGRECNLKNSIKLESEDNNNKPAQKNNAKQDKKTAQDKPAAEKSWHQKKQEAIGSDYVIINTVRLIEMLEMARRAHPDKIKSRSDMLTLLKGAYSPNEKLTVNEIKV